MKSSKQNFAVTNPADIYLLIVNNGYTRKINEICSKLTIERFTSFFIVK